MVHFRFVAQVFRLDVNVLFPATTCDQRESVMMALQAALWAALAFYAG